MKKLLFLYVAALFSIIVQASSPVEFVVITPTYNNEKWCIKNIESVLQQNYPNWHMIIVNDCSTDKTSELLHKYIDEHHASDKITLVDNTERKGACRNFYEITHACNDEVVMVTLDGDDWFNGPFVLDRIAKEYTDPSVWLTYGQFVYWPSRSPGFCRDFPKEVMEKRSFRQYEWLSSHVRTYKAWLFKKIEKNDLMYEGNFLPAAPDIGIMYPMLEMASRGHIRCIRDVLYIYNAVNPLNEHRKTPYLQQLVKQYILKLPKYKAL